MRVLAVDPGTTTTGITLLEVEVKIGRPKVLVLADAAIDAWPTAAAKAGKHKGRRMRTAGLLLAAMPLELDVAGPLDGLRQVLAALGGEVVGATGVVEAVIWWHSVADGKSTAGRGQSLVDLADIAGRMAERVTMATGAECRRPTANEWRRAGFGLNGKADAKLCDMTVKHCLDALKLAPLLPTCNGHVYDAHGIGYAEIMRASGAHRLLAAHSPTTLRALAEATIRKTVTRKPARKVRSAAAPAGTR